MSFGKVFSFRRVAIAMGLGLPVLYVGVLDQPKLMNSADVSTETDVHGSSTQLQLNQKPLVLPDYLTTVSSDQMSSAASSESKNDVSVTVNGETTSLSGNQSVNKTIHKNYIDGNTTVDISIQSNSNSSSRSTSSLNVNMQSNSDIEKESQ